MSTDVGGDIRFCSPFVHLVNGPAEATNPGCLSIQAAKNAGRSCEGRILWRMILRKP